MDEIEQLARQIVELMHEAPNKDLEYAPLVWAGIDNILFAIRKEKQKHENH